MADSSNFKVIFQRLKSILEPYAANMLVKEDTGSIYYLDTRRIMINKQPLFFAAVKIGKSYVSFHLMPVYGFPDLLKNISPELRKRMQGKSCFNFTVMNEPLFKELDELTREGLARYKTQDYI